MATLQQSIVKEAQAAADNARLAGSAASVLAALAANLAIAVAKFAGAYVSGSGALLAEGLHSLADTGNQGLLLWGMRQTRTPPSADFPLGHGRAIYFWSFIVALMLFSMGGLLSIYEGLRKFGAPGELEAPWLAIAILVFGLAAESSSLRFALRRINPLRRGRSLLRWFIDTRRSELMVVLGEDSAALVGLTIALVAVALSALTGNPAYDALGSVLVGVLLIVVAAGLGYETKGLLIGQSAAPEVRRAIGDVLRSRPEIARVVELITLQQGDDVLVAARLEMRATDTAALARDLARCKAALRAAMPMVEWVFLEPASA